MTWLELQSIGTGIEPSGRAKPCANADAAKPAASPNAVSSSMTRLAREATFRFRGLLNLSKARPPPNLLIQQSDPLKYSHPPNSACEEPVFILEKQNRGMSLPGPESGSVDPHKRLPLDSAYSPRGCRFSGKISRNPQWRALACCLPYKPGRGSACTFLRGSKSSRSEDPGHGSSGLPSIPENAARCQ